MTMSWIENDLDSALALARDLRKHALVWWTASWCPPCNELEAAIFSKPRFAARSQELVLARVDGDATGAQLVADRLGVRSYPTPVLLDASGEEVLRLPGGLTEDEFDALLERALRQARPLQALVAAAEAKEPLSGAEVELLAYHWWAVDDMHASGESRLPLLLTLFRRRDGDPRVRLRLLAHAMGASRASPGEWGATNRKDAVALLSEWMASGGLRYSDAYPFLVDPTLLDVVAPKEAPERKALDDALLNAAERLDASGALTHTEHLITLSAILTLRTARDGAPAAQDAMHPRVREAVAKADAESRSSAERQTAMNMAGHLLRSAGLPDEAFAVFLAEVDRSLHGPYFMPYLAGIEFARGRAQEGLAWMRRSWTESKPGASRFERGTQYVARALEMDAGGDLQGDVVAVLSEVGAAPDVVSGRNRGTLRRLLEALARHSRGAPREAVTDETSCVGGVCEVPAPVVSPPAGSPAAASPAESRYRAPWRSSG